MSIRDRLDELMASPKALAGKSEWTRGTSDHHMRWKSPLDVNGELCGINLEIKSYPREDGLRFTIQLMFQIAIVRLEYWRYASHINWPPVPDGCPEFMVEGPHVHLWSDNRQFINTVNLPRELKFARMLPTNVHGFPNAFRWFCGETNIVCPREIPELPKSDLLL